MATATTSATTNRGHRAPPTTPAASLAAARKNGAGTAAGQALMGQQTGKKRNPLDRLYGRTKVARDYLARSLEEARGYLAREPGESRHRQGIAKVVEALDLDLAPALAGMESLSRASWEPRGGVLPRVRAGQQATIKENRRAHYLRHGLYDEATICAPVVVQKVAGGHAVVLLSNKEILAPVPANWLEPVAANA
jgi:hypothetical protein